MPKNYDPHKKYKRIGECKHCGRCCDLHCSRLKWIVTRRIEDGETIALGKDKGSVYSFCEIFEQLISEGSCTLEQRKGFPYNPWQTPPKCGYSWIEE